MSKCEVKIVFDRNSRTYKGGETITGYVEVRTNKEVDCRELSLMQLWSTHGRGNRDSGESNQQSLFAGTWSVGTFAGSMLVTSGNSLTITGSAYIAPP